MDLIQIIGDFGCPKAGSFKLSGIFFRPPGGGGVPSSVPSSLLLSLPTCATKLTSAPARGLISIRHGTGEQNMYSGGSKCEFGGTGGPRGHILCPTKVNQIDTGFDQNVVKNGQKGVPCFYRFFGEPCGHFGPLTPRVAIRGAVLPPRVHPPGQKPHFEQKY